MAHRNCPILIEQQKNYPALFEPLETGNPAVIDITGNDQQIAEDAASALTEMAGRAQVEQCNI